MPYRSKAAPANPSERTGVFTGTNTFGTKLAGILHFVSANSSGDSNVTGFYSKTTAKGKTIPLRGSATRDGKLVLWASTGSDAEFASPPDDAQRGSPGELSYVDTTSTTTLKGVYQGKPNDWHLDHAWIAEVLTREQLTSYGSELTYDPLLAWIDRAKAAPAKQDEEEKARQQVEKAKAESTERYL